MFNTILTMIGLNLDELIDEAYNEYKKQEYISENIDLISCSLERAEIIFNAEYTESYIYDEDLEYELNKDSYESNKESYRYDMGFL